MDATFSLRSKLDKFRKLTLVFCSLTLAFISCAPVYAWKDFGHMAVAYLAYQQLKPEVKARADELITINPYYQSWYSRASFNHRVDLKTQIFMMSSIWADQIKDPTSGYEKDGTAGGNRPAGSGCDANIGYKDMKQHKYWHFADIPFSQDGSRLPWVPSPNAQTEIATFRKTLSSKVSDEVKSYDLVWLLHIVGDVHQPLHCVTRVSKGMPGGDSGGNDVLIHACSTDSPNLHDFWDNMPSQGSMKDVVDFCDKLSPPDPKLAGIADEKVWINESFEYAKGLVYQPPVGPERGPWELNLPYEENAAALARERIALAGARLANLLNNELK